MKRIFSLIFVICLILSCSTTVFANDNQVTVRDNGYDWTRYENDKITLNVYNWGMYISNGEDDSLDTVKAFENLTGIDVNYTTFDSNESMYSKISSGSGVYDVIIPSDYMIAKMAGEGMLKEINLDNIPNFDLIGDKYKNQSYDPNNIYSVAYTWGLVGIIYNTTVVEESDIETGWDIFWNEYYDGQILMFNNSRDAFAISLKQMGESLNPNSVELIEKSADNLIEQKRLVQSYVMDEVFDKMIGNEAAIAPYYVGDGTTMMEQNEELSMIIPKQGTNMYIDAMCIPSNCKNQEAAEMFINFMCETEVALANIEYIYYSTPQTEAFELLDEETRTNELMYPPEEILANCESFKALDYELNSAMDTSWSRVRAQDSEGSGWMMIVVLAMLVALIIFSYWRKYIKKKRSEY